ncbi:MAG: class I SAM-dependent methyltransferase [Anaerolineaceae bacterium]|nr:class I SAM-dependent methyltransferase [Anaerolineaceae bacterium]
MNGAWQNGNSYERFMGRWSHLIAREFLRWLAVPPNSKWLDVGCGTGSLTKQILETNRPQSIVSVDASPEFVAFARQMVPDTAVQFRVGLAQSLELEANQFDAAVSGLVLNFVPQPEAAIAEMLRVTKPGGTVGIFLWDYAEGMEMLRYFWNAAVALDKNAEALDEGVRFPLCQRDELESLVDKCGLKQIVGIPIEVVTHFQGFVDYWAPFLGHVGPAPAYVMSLTPKQRQKLEDRVHAALPIREDGSISLVARAWAVKGITE